MQNALGKWLAALALLIMLLLIALHFLNGKAPQQSAPPLAPATNKLKIPTIAIHPPRPVAKAASDVPAPEPKLSQQQIENCVQSRNRNAASLLAAYHALADTNYLNEATKNYPDDPHVISVVLARDAFPSDRRKWLDTFKEISPDNSLANYLSAEDYVKNGQADAAINELRVAAAKPLFDDFTMQSRLDEEELIQCGGKSALAAAKNSLTDFARDDLPMLATLKRIVSNLSDLQKQKAAEGDTNFIQNLSQMELALANRMLTGDDGKFVINQLVGAAIQSYALKYLDQNTAYDFLDGKTPAQVMEENKQQKKALGQLAKDFEAVAPTLNDEEMASYLQRSKIYGEVAAWQWVVQQHPPPAQQ